MPTVCQLAGSVRPTQLQPVGGGGGSFAAESASRPAGGLAATKRGWLARFAGSSGRLTCGPKQRTTTHPQRA